MFINIIPNLATKCKATMSFDLICWGCPLLLLPLYLLRTDPGSQSPWWANMCAILFHPALGEAAQKRWKGNGPAERRIR